MSAILFFLLGIVGVKDVKEEIEVIKGVSHPIPRGMYHFIAEIIFCPLFPILHFELLDTTNNNKKPFRAEFPESPFSRLDFESETDQSWTSSPIPSPILTWFEHRYPIPSLKPRDSVFRV